MRNQHQMRLSNVVEKFKTKQTAEILALRKRVQTVCIRCFVEIVFRLMTYLYMLAGP